MAQPIPIACDLGALSPEQRTRRSGLAKELGLGRARPEELADGYAFKLGADAATLVKAAEFVSLERLCCPFFKFEIETAGGGAPTWIRLRGDAGVKDFIAHELGLTLVTKIGVPRAR